MKLTNKAGTFKAHDRGLDSLNYKDKTLSIGIENDLVEVFDIDSILINNFNHYNLILSINIYKKFQDLMDVYKLMSEEKFSNSYTTTSKAHINYINRLIRENYFGFKLIGSLGADIFLFAKRISINSEEVDVTTLK